VRGVALHVLEIKEVLSALSHLSQVGQETQQLVEFIRNTRVAIDAVLVQRTPNLIVAFLNMTSVPQGSNVWIQEKDELEADVICAVKFKSTELGGQVSEGLRHGWYSEKGQREQFELLSVGQCGLVGKLVVHPLMDLVHYQHLGPRVLQQPHLIIHLQFSEVEGISRPVHLGKEILIKHFAQQLEKIDLHLVKGLALQ